VLRFQWKCAICEESGQVHFLFCITGTSARVVQQVISRRHVWPINLAAFPLLSGWLFGAAVAKNAIITHAVCDSLSHTGEL